MWFQVISVLFLSRFYLSSLNDLTPITSGHICDSILSFLQNWSKVKKKSSFRGLVCTIKLLIASLYFVIFLWIGNSSFVRNFFIYIRTCKKNLHTSIREYFPSAKDDVSCRENPFSASADYLDLRLREIENLTDIAPDRNLIDIFKLKIVFEFWSLRTSEYPEIANHSVQQLLSVVSTQR